MTTPPDTGDKQPQVNPFANFLRTFAADEIDALSAKCAALQAENMRLREALDLKIKVSKLQAIIDRAHFELSLEDVNPDDNRAAVLAILKPTASQTEVKP